MTTGNLRQGTYWMERLSRKLSGMYLGGKEHMGFILIYSSYLMTWSVKESNICCCCSVAKLCPTVCDHMEYSMPDSPVLLYLPEFVQIHVPWVGEAMQVSHPLLPSSLTFNLSQHQGLFQWVSSLHQVATVLELQLQHQSFQWIFRVDFLWDWLIWSNCCSRDSQESSPAPQFKSIHSLVLSWSLVFTVQFSHPYMTTGKGVVTSGLTRGPPRG